MSDSLPYFEIRKPTDDERPALFQMLGEVFAVEEGLFADAAKGKVSIYTWEPLCLFVGDEIAGNVSRFDMNIWLHERPFQISGIGSVATPEKWRRKGIAKRLMTEWMKCFDEERATSVLFTDLPAVYEKHGYSLIDPTHPLVTVTDIPVNAHGLRAEQFDQLNADLVARMMALYDGPYQNYDGKVIRDPGYLDFFTYLFNGSGKRKIIFCSDSDGDRGHLILWQLKDRLVVCEAACAPDDAETVHCLLSQIQRATTSQGIKHVSLALPIGHPLLNYLAAHDIPAPPELNAPIESFMVREPGRREPTLLKDLKWSLADKF
jgi:predicted acetyltransferase